MIFVMLLESTSKLLRCGKVSKPLGLWTMRRVLIIQKEGIEDGVGHVAPKMDSRLALFWLTSDLAKNTILERFLDGGI